jgi:hypothetical protein
VLRPTAFYRGGRLQPVKPGASATGGTLSCQSTCPLRKGLQFGGFLGAERTNAGIALVYGLCDLERSGDHFGWGSSWLGKAGRATFELYPGICLTTEEKHGKPQSGRPSQVQNTLRLTFSYAVSRTCWDSWPDLNSRDWPVQWVAVGSPLLRQQARPCLCQVYTYTFNMWIHTHFNNL